MKEEFMGLTIETKRNLLIINDVLIGTCNGTRFKALKTAMIKLENEDYDRIRIKINKLKSKEGVK